MYTSGPCGVSALAVSGTNLFAGTGDRGVFLSTNNGTSWTASSLKRYVRAFAIIGTNLFAGTYGYGVFVSTDNGTSWTAVNAGLTNTYVNALAVSPNGTGGTNLFAGTYEGVFVSTNNGATWSEANRGLAVKFLWFYVSPTVKALAFIPDGRAAPISLPGRWGWGLCFNRQRHKLDCGQYRLDEP